MFAENLQSGFTEVNGQKIAYYRIGRGEPLFLIHGITTYSFIWRRLLPRLALQYDVIAVDLLGCGNSDKPEGVDYSIRSQAQIIYQVTKNLSIDRIHLVTHDIGGGIGQIMAVNFPDLIIDLTVINTIAFDYWPVQPIITMRIPFVRQLAMATMDLGVFGMIIRRGIYHKERVTDELLELFWAPLREREGRQGFLRLAKCLNNRHLMDLSSQLRSLKMPVLIIRGDADPYLAPIISERLHDEIPNSRFERIATGGHFIQEDEPELLVDLITDFIANKGK